MNAQHIHLQKINRYVLRSKIWLAVLAIWGLFAVWVGVYWTGSSSLQPITSEQSAPEKTFKRYAGVPFIVVGILFVMIGGYGVLTAHQQIQRAIHIYSKVSPKVARAIVTIDNTTDAALNMKIVISLPESGSVKEWHGILHPPGWDVKSIESIEQSVKVFIDPKSNEPVVLEIEDNLLFTFLGSWK